MKSTTTKLYDRARAKYLIALKNPIYNNDERSRTAALNKYLTIKIKQQEQDDLN